MAFGDRKPERRPGRIPRAPVQIVVPDVSKLTLKQLEARKVEAQAELATARRELEGRLTEAEEEATRVRLELETLVATELMEPLELELDAIEERIKVLTVVPVIP